MLSHARLSAWLVVAAISSIVSGPLCAQPPTPPQLPFEFRGAWVASVHNLDWPSQPGLSAGAQQAELIALFDRAVALRLNAILLQVRPASDALYDSPFEPFSPYLTGTMGRAPRPAYDPLAFAVREAHARGLELHAWINPFRAVASAKIKPSPGHVSQKHKEWVRSYGSQQWIDPGLPEARTYVLAVLTDIVRRYDIDGLHLDDYFYPYPIRDARGSPIPFPDDSSFKRHGSGDRLAWRRANVDAFVQDLYRQTKRLKPWVKLGISPFGIWRPGIPEGTTAELDAFNHLGADSRRWFREGWLDYFSPQLYWPIGSKGQSFTKLIQWWDKENAAQRHLWPGLAVDRVGKDRGPAEIAAQIKLTRNLNLQGHVLWNYSAARRGSMSKTFGATYPSLALVPPCPWLESATPDRPELRLRGDSLSFETTGRATVARWLFQARVGGTWTARLLGPEAVSVSIPEGAEVVALTPVSRTGQLGPTATATR